MDLTDLHIFRSVVQAGGVTRAAEKLNRVQSNVTTRVRQLESYMIEGNFFATQFYADVEGHPEDRSLVFAFEELAFYSKEMKILGVYPAHPFRATFEEAVA